MTIAQASKVTGKSAQFIRVCIQQGMFPGCMKRNKERNSYEIFPDKLADFMGISMEELKRRLNE